MNVRLRPGWARQVEKAVGRDGTEPVAEAVAERMRSRAPRANDGGYVAADNIRHEADPDEPAGWRVSWEKRGFYLFFHEVGTARTSPRPFAAPTAAEFTSR